MPALPESVHGVLSQTDASKVQRFHGCVCTNVFLRPCHVSYRRIRLRQIRPVGMWHYLGFSDPIVRCYNPEEEISFLLLLQLTFYTSK